MDERLQRYEMWKGIQKVGKLRNEAHIAVIAARQPKTLLQAAAVHTRPICNLARAVGWRQEATRGHASKPDWATLFACAHLIR